MSEKSDKLRAMLEKEKERRIKLNNRIEILERRIQEEDSAEVNEMVRKGARLLMGVGIHLDIGEQLWGVLHLVNQNRRLVQLQKQLRVIFCQRPIVQIIQ